MLPSLTWWPSRMLHHMLSSMDLHQLSARARMLLPSSPSLTFPQHWHPHPLRPMIQMRLMSFMSFSCVCVSVLFRLFCGSHCVHCVHIDSVFTVSHHMCAEALMGSDDITIRDDGLMPMGHRRVRSDGLILMDPWFMH